MTTTTTTTRNTATTARPPSSILEWLASELRACEDAHTKINNQFERECSMIDHAIAESFEKANYAKAQWMEKEQECSNLVGQIKAVFADSAEKNSQIDTAVEGETRFAKKLRRTNSTEGVVYVSLGGQFEGGREVEL